MFFSYSTIIAILIIVHFIVLLVVIVYLKKTQRKLEILEKKANSFETKLETINIKVEDIENRFIFFTKIVRDELDLIKSEIQKTKEEIVEFELKQNSYVNSRFYGIIKLAEIIKNFIRKKIIKNREVS
jgi:peptidoglycan hydrolase CwlO-like protein